MIKENLSDKTNNLGQEISFRDLIKQFIEWRSYLLTKWLWIILFAILGGAIGFFYIKSKKIRYKAVSTFVLEESGGGSGLGQYAGLASMVGIDLGVSGSNGIFQGDNIIELYKSRSMLETTLLSEVLIKGKKRKLIDIYIEFNDLKDRWALNPKLVNINFNLKNGQIFTRDQDSIVSSIITDINANLLSVSRPNKKLSIIAVEVNSLNEDFSKALNEQIVYNVNNFYLKTKTLKLTENVYILQRQTDSVKAVMNGAIFSSATTMDMTPNINATRMVMRAPIQRSQFNAEVNKEVLSELVKNLELSKITLRKETPLLQVIDKPVLPLQKEKSSKAVGLIIGGIIGGFLCVSYLIFKKIILDFI